VPYEVSTPVFEGPFDLLLHLIVREQVDLYEVPLSRIVDAYLEELERLAEGGLDLELATEFLLIAATLVDLKARRLLPGSDEIDLDDELGRWEERDLLLARLLECKTFKDAAAVLSTMAEDARRSFPRRAGPGPEFLALTPDPLDGVRPAQLRDAFLRAVRPRPAPTVDIRHVTAIRASVTDAVVELLDELPRAGRIAFRRLVAGLVERMDVVVRFLALLELYKDGMIDLVQADARAGLDVVWLGGGDPTDGAPALAGVDAYEG
jgi:segregation and condensation protein A